MLTPSFAANAPLERLVFIRCSASNSASNWVLFWQECETTLMALITNWQNGCRNHPFRQNFVRAVFIEVVFQKNAAGIEKRPWI